MQCEHCKKEVEDEELITVISDNNGNLDDVITHYKCYQEWINNQFFAHEAIIVKGKVILI